jgi:hypothetical protein
MSQGCGELGGRELRDRWGAFAGQRHQLLHPTDLDGVGVAVQGGVQVGPVCGDREELGLGGVRGPATPDRAGQGGGAVEVLKVVEHVFESMRCAKGCQDPFPLIHKGKLSQIIDYGWSILNGCSCGSSGR